MRYVESAHTSRRYSKIGLGTWQFGSPEWGYGDEYADVESARIVRRAVELGVTLFDTAEIYGLGRGERILGRALRGALDDAAVAREDLVVASKIFPALPVSPMVQQRGLASAARLDLGAIDLYQVHKPHPVVGDATTMRGMRVLRTAGVVGDVGVSNYPLKRWRLADRALGTPVLSNQVEYSLLHRGPERDLVPFAEQHGRVVLAHSPLAKGVLSGRYDENHRPSNGIRAYNPAFLPENLRRVAPLVGLLREVGESHGATPSQIALAWTIRNPAVAAIPGASSVSQLEANAAAAEIDLTDDEYASLSAASDRLKPLKGIAAARSLVAAHLSSRR